MVYAYIDLGNRHTYYTYYNSRVSIVSVYPMLIMITSYSR
jgi:hypothetical protein